MSSRLEKRAVAMLRRRRAALPAIGEMDRSTEGRGHTALVTGASSGIGRSIAQLLAAKGYDVVAVARRAERLKEVQVELESRWEVKVHPLPCDLSVEGASAEITDELDRLGIEVDYLVNNAGLLQYGFYLDHSWEKQYEFLRVMCLGVAELTHRLMPHMVEQRWGRIINVTSVGGFFPGSRNMGLYIASKTFVQRISEAINLEYGDAGVHCTVCAPGATESELYLADHDITDYLTNSLIPQLSMMRPERIAREAYAGCAANKKFVVPGVSYRLWIATLQHAPAPLRYKMVEWVGTMGPQPTGEPAPQV